MVILQTMGWFLENPNHGYYYNQPSHRLVHTCRKSPPLNLFVFVITVKWKAIKLVPATFISIHLIRQNYVHFDKTRMNCPQITAV